MQTFLMVAGGVWFLSALVFTVALCLAGRREIPDLESVASSPEERVDARPEFASALASTATSSDLSLELLQQEIPFADSVPTGM